MTFEATMRLMGQGLHARQSPGEGNHITDLEGRNHDARELQSARGGRQHRQLLVEA
jgi:hypothetical protein